MKQTNYKQMHDMCLFWKLQIKHTSWLVMLPQVLQTNKEKYCGEQILRISLRKTANYRTKTLHIHIHMKEIHRI